MFQYLHGLRLSRSEGVLNKYLINIVGELSNHSYIAAFTCFNKVVKHMLEKIDVPVDKGYTWSDGMTAQFWSRFVFMLLSRFDKTKNWRGSSFHRELLVLNFTRCPMTANPTSRSTTKRNVIPSFVDTRKTNMSKATRVYIASAVTVVQTC